MHRAGAGGEDEGAVVVFVQNLCVFAKGSVGYGVGCKARSGDGFGEEGDKLEEDGVVEGIFCDFLGEAKGEKERKVGAVEQLRAVGVGKFEEIGERGELREGGAELSAPGVHKRLIF